MAPPAHRPLPVDGLRLASVGAGIRQRQRDDLALIEIRDGASCAAVFTRNRFCAAPVRLAREHLRRASPRYLLINSGNANAGTGLQGDEDARSCCGALAALVDCEPDRVLPFSTGVIGEPLPVERIRKALPDLLPALDRDAWESVARAIMTTDTVPKIRSTQRVIDGVTVTVTGIAKGAGMIRPDMATMLAYVATDAPVAPALLQDCLQRAVDRSFNRISVDGDTSTNDACVLIATGAAALSRIERRDSEAADGLFDAVAAVCRELARDIVRDGEGATRLIDIRVSGGRSEADCLAVAQTVANSPLVKTAFFAGDPNWGRILAAVGRAPIPELLIERVSIHLGDVRIVHDGGRDPDYTEEAGQRVMAAEEIEVHIDLGAGGAEVLVWSCDLSFDYVRINAEYRT